MEFPSIQGGNASEFDYDIYNAEAGEGNISMLDVAENDCEEENPLSSSKSYFLEKRLVNAELALCSLNILGYDTREYYQEYGSAILPEKSLNLNVSSFDVADEKLMLTILHFLVCQLNNQKYEEVINQYWPYNNLESKLELKRVIEAEIMVSLVETGLLPAVDAKIWNSVGEKNKPRAASWWSTLRSLSDICMQITLDSVLKASAAAALREGSSNITSEEKSAFRHKEVAISHSALCCTPVSDLQMFVAHELTVIQGMVAEYLKTQADQANYIDELTSRLLAAKKTVQQSKLTVQPETQTPLKSKPSQKPPFTDTNASPHERYRKSYSVLRSSYSGSKDISDTNRPPAPKGSKAPTVGLHVAPESVKAVKSAKKQGNSPGPMPSTPTRVKVEEMVLGEFSDEDKESVRKISAIRSRLVNLLDSQRFQEMVTYMDGQILQERDNSATEAYARSKRRLAALASLGNVRPAQKPRGSCIGASNGEVHTEIIREEQLTHQTQLSIPLTYEDAERNNKHFLVAMDLLIDQIEQINDSFNNYFVLRLQSNSVDDPLDSLLM